MKKAGPKVRLSHFKFLVCRDLVAGAEGNALTNLGDRLINEANRPLAVAAFVWFRGLQFGASVLEQSQGSVHVGLRAKRVADTQTRSHG
jgi:hypothetical protein